MAALRTSPNPPGVPPPGHPGKGADSTLRTALTRRNLLTAGTVAAAAALLGREAFRRKPLVALCVDFDVSGSQDLQERTANAALLAAVVEQDLPAEALVALFPFSERAEEVYRDRPGGRQDLLPVIQKHLLPERKRPGRTYPHLALQANQTLSAARFLEREPVEGWGIWCLWDGDDSAEAETARALAGLKSDSRLRVVWLCGIAPAYRAQVQRRFSSALGDRLLLSGTEDSSSDRARFREMLAASHPR